MTKNKRFKRSARAAQRTAAFRINIDCDDLGHTLVHGPLGAGMSNRPLQVQCGTGWRRHVRDELETDGRKRQLALDSMGQVTVADLLDGSL